MDIQDALQFTAEEAKRQGADKFDIVAGVSDSSGLSLFEGKVKNTEISSSQGIGIRFFKNDRPGYAYSERLTKEALSQTVKDAAGHAELTDPLELDLPEKMEPRNIDLKQWAPGIEEITLDEMKEFSLKVEAKALAGGESILNVPYLGMGKSSSRTWFLNGSGVSYSESSNSLSAGIGTVAAKGDIHKMGVYSKAGRDFSEFNADYIGEKSVERAMELLEAESIAGGEYPVVLSNRVSGQLFSMFSSPFYAEVIHKGQSRLQGKLGEVVAASNFSLSHEPLRVDLPGSSLFDGEGVPTQSIQVIENGVLNSFLYNLESAKKDKVASNGCASRGYSGKVGTSFANYVVPLGGESLDNLLARHSKCLYVVKLEGGSGCSSISGEISIGAQGFLYENGKMVKAVDKVTLSTNYFDLLKNIEGLSNEYNDTFSSYKIPDVLVSQVSVAS